MRGDTSEAAHEGKTSEAEKGEIQGKIVKKKQSRVGGGKRKGESYKRGMN